MQKEAFLELLVSDCKQQLREGGPANPSGARPLPGETPVNWPGVPSRVTALKTTERPLTAASANVITHFLSSVCPESPFVFSVNTCLFFPWKPFLPASFSLRSEGQKPLTGTTGGTRSFCSTPPTAAPFSPQAGSSRDSCPGKPSRRQDSVQLTRVFRTSRLSSLPRQLPGQCSQRQSRGLGAAGKPAAGKTPAKQPPAAMDSFLGPSLQSSSKHRAQVWQPTRQALSRGIES